MRRTTMSKPSWTSPSDEVFLTNAPDDDFKYDNNVEAFLVYYWSSYNKKWFAGWKSYARLWSALRYGMGLHKNKEAIYCVRNLKTGETVWRSWEDENKYRLDY